MTLEQEDPRDVSPEDSAQGQTDPTTRPPVSLSGSVTLPGTPTIDTLPSVNAKTPDPDTTPQVALRISAPPSSPDEISHEHLADPLIGLVVAGRYRILTPIGRGGMGVVYKVEHVHLGKMLAMKLLAGELSMSPEVVRRFKREAQTVSRLSSPNTVHVFDYGVDAGLTYIVMELVTGKDLAAVLAAEGPMPFPRLGKIVLQILSSLGEAHALGIVHRDVKPQNVMITTTSDGKDLAKVLDFGIAKLREEADPAGDVTRRDQLIGTPYFIPPELIRGDPVDHRADLYAVGVLLYHALTGHYPFHGKNSASTLVKHVTEVALPPSSRTRSQKIPPGVDALVMRALEKDPAARWQNAEELQAAIAKLLGDLGAASGIDELLDADALEKLTRTAIAGAFGEPGEALASRDEVEAYERKLRSRRHLVYFAGLLVVLGGAGAGLFTWIQKTQQRFLGVEIEPNDNPPTATPLPLGKSASGFLGKRIDATHSDRDFYSFELPKADGEAERVVDLLVTALPNMESCTLLYQQGFHAPIAQYCVGRAARDLAIPRLRLSPGVYYASVLQDLDPRGDKRAKFVHENVSDTYTITISLPLSNPGLETEPNDEAPATNVVELGQTITGMIGWIDDQDVFCAGPSASGKKIRWTARDAARDAGSVLEVTLLRGREASSKTRVHVSGEGAISAEDARSPWTGPIVGDEDGNARCVRVRLARDPWMTDAPRIPTGGAEPYHLTVEPAL